MKLCHNVTIFFLLFTAQQSLSYTVKRNADFKDIDKEAGLDGALVESDDNQHFNDNSEYSQFRDDHIHILANNEFKVMLSSDEEYDDEEEDDNSVYETIRDENQDILTKIEKLYTAFRSHEHHHGHLPALPLLSIVEQEPHSMTIMLKPREVQPDTMVRYILYIKLILSLEFKPYRPIPHLNNHIQNVVCCVVVLWCGPVVWVFH
jgi:hypothetical protein